MLNAGDTAWVLASAALVMLMTPGLAFFYGGMVRAKSVLNMLMMNFICLAIVAVLWVLYGFGESFSNDAFSGLIGNFDHAGFANTWGQLAGFATAATDTAPEVAWPGADAIPVLAFAMFQLMFAIITPALISGAIADRAKFWGWALFVVLWVTIVYFPVAHWVFSFDGFIGPDAAGGWIANKLKALDFAGGTAVHINAGAAGLALAIVLGKRKGWPKDVGRPHNVPFVLLGAALLWFGWYGFNAGSALSAGDLAGVAFTNTTVATAAAVLGWLLVEQLKFGKPTTLGAASGAIAGLVAITPACGFVTPLGSIAIGVIAGVLCALAVSLKYKLGFDDSLDVVGVHLVGGLIGTLLVGFLAVDGVSGPAQFGKQALGAFSVLAFSFTVSWLLAKLVQVTVGFRADADDETAGVDQVFHAETAYDFGAVGGSAARRRGAPVAPSGGPASATGAAGTARDDKPGSLDHKVDA